MLGALLAADRVAALVAAANRQSRPWLEFRREDFAAGYNRHPFLVEHRLADHPLFTFESLAALCRRLPPNQVHVRAGVVPADAEFDTSLKRFNQGLSLEDALDHLVERGAYIAVNNPEFDAVYGPAIEGFLGEIAAQTEPLEPGLNWFSTYLFISAQNAVTPYHMDREMNFLLQVRGTKTVRLWDPNDDEIMSPAQKDILLAARDQPRPTYKPSFDAKAMVFELRPGIGVHHPFIAPHLVTTNSSLSISLAITFRTARSDLWTDAHIFNARCRRLGLNPSTVGKRAIVDDVKARAIRAIRTARNVTRRAKA